MKKNLTHAVLLSAAIGLLTTSVVAQETDAQREAAGRNQVGERDREGRDRDQTNPNQRETQRGNQGQAANRLIQKLDQHVDLKEEQKQQIREIVNKNRQDNMAKWREFEEAHARAVHLEAMMIAALADGMNDDQKREFHEKRRQHKDPAQQSSQANRGSEAKRDQGQRDQDQRSESSNRDRAENTRDRDAHAGSRQGDSDERVSESGKRSEREGNDATQQYVWTMVIVPAQQQYTSMNLDSQQKSACDNVCRSYHKQLSSAWDDVQRLHRELVATEAMKLEAIEQTLDEQQLKKLRDSRQQADES